MSHYLQVSAELIALKNQLKKHHYWQDVPPSLEALQSQTPFAIDTLTCTEWLQWIFLEKMFDLVESQAPLPSQMQITPYVEEALQGMAGTFEIIQICKNLDGLLSS